jgi:hypothetical protein
MERFREGVERMASLHFAESQPRDSAKWRDRGGHIELGCLVPVVRAPSVTGRPRSGEERGFHRSRDFAQLRLLQLRKIARSQTAKSTVLRIPGTE